MLINHTILDSLSLLVLVGVIIESQAGDFSTTAMLLPKFIATGWPARCRSSHIENLKGYTSILRISARPPENTFTIKVKKLITHLNEYKIRLYTSCDEILHILLQPRQEELAKNFTYISRLNEKIRPIPVGNYDEKSQAVNEFLLGCVTSDAKRKKKGAFHVLKSRAWTLLAFLVYDFQAIVELDLDIDPSTWTPHYSRHHATIKKFLIDNAPSEGADGFQYGAQLDDLMHKATTSREYGDIVGELIRLCTDISTWEWDENSGLVTFTGTYDPFSMSRLYPIERRTGDKSDPTNLNNLFKLDFREPLEELHALSAEDTQTP